ncbi:MAG: tyrosine/phenylalanine carboxypeptidase domain-containing protein [Candidatus Woesebacteria bacterium]
MTFIQRILPANLEEEKKKFFFDPLYNPQFSYTDPVSPEELQRYGGVSSEYVSLAEKVLDYAEKNALSPAFEKTDQKEPLLSKEDVEKIVVAFLEHENLSRIITLQFTRSTVARTSMYKNTLIIRLPVEYTQSGLLGMLYHEIGTHQIRSMNDRQQLWRSKAKELKLHPHFVTEEGLAVLHSQIPKENKLLVFQAINYLAVFYAQAHSFSEVYAMLKDHISDRERRFDISVRVKRGIVDTSKPGAFPKDQIYFSGAIEVWKWLRKRDFDPTDLYIGKIAQEDVDMLKPLSTVQPLLLPTFITENMAGYKKSLLEIGKMNFFDKISDATKDRET